MAKSVARLTEGNFVAGGTTTNTASISPAASSALIVAVVAFDSATMSISGAGLTWTTRINGAAFADGSLLWVFVAAGASPSAGVLTLTFDTDAFVNWAVDSVTGTVSLSAPSTTNTVVATGTGTALAGTLAAFGNASNGTWAYGLSADEVTNTQGSGFTLVDTNKGTAIFSYTDFSEFRDSNDTSPDASTDTSAAWGFAAIEIAEAAGGTSYTLTADQGTYVLTGSDARIDRELNGDQGSFTITGQAANLSRGYRCVADQGSYVLVGQNANLQYSGAGPKIITADQGSVAITGQDAGLRRAARLVCDSGTYNIQGFAVVGGTAIDSRTSSGGVLKVRKVLIVSASGRTRWVHYIPCKQATSPSVGRYDNNGAVEVQLLGSGSGLTEWVDYIPIVEVADSDSGKWRYDNAGFIPILIVE